MKNFDLDISHRTFFIFVSCEVWEDLHSISSESDRTAHPITALTTASYLPKLIFGSLPQKMLSIRSYRGNQNPIPAANLASSWLLDLELWPPREENYHAGTDAAAHYYPLFKPGCKKRDFFFFKPQQGLGNDFVACLSQKDKVFPQHFKAQTCVRCICLKWVLHTVLSLNQEPSSDRFAFPSLSSCRLPALILSRLKSSPRSTLSLSNSISFNSRVSIFCRGPGSITQIPISTTSGALSSSEVK